MPNTDSVERRVTYSPTWMSGTSRVTLARVRGISSRAMHKNLLLPLLTLALALGVVSAPAQEKKDAKPAAKEVAVKGSVLDIDTF